MPTPLTGLHHVTAFAKDPVANHDFYTRVLGMRMVKKTVNFDDPLTYHLYYADHNGSPGTLLTHFPHPNAKPGAHGSPEISETLLAVAPGALDAWSDRLRAAGVETRDVEVAGEPRLAFADHDDMRFALVEREHGAVDAVDRVEGVVVRVADLDAAASFLRDTLGFEDAAGADKRVRMTVGDSAVELVHAPDDTPPNMRAGIVHHVAWRVPDDDAQRRVIDLLEAARIGVTPVQDRKYFRSIYFRIPGGVNFEVATDGPGFDVDEPLDTLGTTLQLPDQYEPRRDEIEAHLVPLDA
jgi:glyoxalase family protein